MKRIIISLLALLVAAVSTQAKSWKIGPASVNGMDFADINAAMESDKVGTGDTLYLDQYFSTSVKQVVNKKVVIIGTGYDTSFTDEQVVATLTDSLTLWADGIQVKSVKLKNVKFYADECTLERCYTNNIEIGTVPKALNHIYSCYITGTVGNQVGVTSTITSISGGTTTTYFPAQFDVQNCVFKRTTNYNQLQYLTNSIINNNTFYLSYSTSGGTSCCLSTITNSQITNNIIYGYNSNNNSQRVMTSDVSNIGSGNTIEHNICNVTISNYPNNKNAAINSIMSLFAQTGNFSDFYKLKTDVSDNYALTYGTDGKEVGCHGGMFGCPSGGRAQYIPYFTKVVVGQRTENGKLPVSLEVKIQDE